MASVMRENNKTNIKTKTTITKNKHRKTNQILQSLREN